MSSSGYGRRVSGYAIDQAISGGSNILVVLVAAQLLDVDAFARVSLAMLAYGVVLVVVRSLICIPMLMYPHEVRQQTADVVGSAWLLGLISGAVAGVSAVVVGFFDRPMGLLIGVLAVTIPLLVVQDAGRFIGLTTRHTSRAITLDLIWLVAAAVAITSVTMLHGSSALLFLIAWAVPGAATGLLVHLFWPSSPRPSVRWLKLTRRDSGLTLAEAAISQLGALVLIASMGILGGRKYIAGFAGAQVLARPFSLLLMALGASGVNEVAEDRSDLSHVVRSAWRTSAIAGGAALLLGGILLAIPDSLGELVLADSWGPTQLVLWPFACYMLADAVATGPTSALRGLRQLPLLVANAVVWIVLAGVITCLGAWWFGPEAIPWGMAVSRTVNIVILVLLLRRHLHLAATTVAPRHRASASR